MEGENIMNFANNYTSYEQCGNILLKRGETMPNSKEDNKTFFTMRIDKEEKEQLKRLYDDMGMDLTTAVKIFFKQSLLKNGMPFRPTRVNLDNLEARREAKLDTLKEYKDTSELWTDLNE